MNIFRLQDDYGITLPSGMKAIDSRFVIGDGHMDPELIVVGKCPGDDETRSGKPFTGGTGRMCRAMLAEQGLSSYQMYYTNVAKYRPPRDDMACYSHATNKKRWQPGAEFFGWRDLLFDELNVFRPKLIIALGNEAMYALTGHWGILNYRGSVYPSKGTIEEIPVLCSIHAAAIVRMYAYKPLVEMDFRRAYKILSGTRDWKPPERKFITAENVDHAERLCAETVANGERICCDVESRGKYISLVGFAVSPTSAFNIEIIKPDGSSRWNVSEEIRVWRAIQHVLTHPKLDVVYHNGFYDRSMFNFHGVRTKSTYLDTMVAFKVAYPEFRKGLNVLTSVYTQDPYYKDDRKVDAKVNQEGTYDKSPWKTFLDYNMKDCCITLDCSYKVEQDLDHLRLKKHYHDMSYYLAEACFKASVRGFKIDLDFRRELSKRGHALMKELNQVIAEESGTEVNIASPKQTKEALERMGFMNVSSTSRLAMLKLLQQRPGDKCLNAMLKLRRLNKFVGTYVDATLSHDDRLRFTLGSESTETGRPASRKSCHNTGFNICATPRNVSGNPLAKEFRNMVVADPGKVMIICDQEQAESRMTGVLAQCDAMMKVFDEGRDYHAYAGSIFSKGFGEEKREDEITKGSLFRDLSKAGGHAVHYGMKKQRMSDEILKRLEIYVPPSICESIIDIYLKEKHPEITGVYWDYVQKTITATRTLTNPLGRKRFFNGRFDNDLWQESFGWIPQSTSGDITNFAIATLERDFSSWIDFNLHTYDGLIVQVDEDRVDEACGIIKDLMEIELSYRGIPLVVPAEVQVGRSWGETTLWRG
jgi:uracil-DNA glycosylase family 4